MTTRRDFVKVSTAGLVGLALPGKVFAQTNAVFEFQGLIAFAVARTKGATGVPKTSDRVTALLVRESVHTIRKLRIPAAWVVGKTSDVEEDITDCSIEVVGPKGGVSLVVDKRSSTNGVPNECGKPGEWADVSWIANLERACGDGEVKSAMLQAPTTVSPVCTRLIMNGGTFKGGPPSDSVNVNYSKQVWAMDPAPATPYKQCFTDSTLWDTGSASCTIRITGADKKVREHTVTATTAGQIVLTNLPASGGDNKDLDRSVHFAHYYALVAKPGSSPIPVKDHLCADLKMPSLTSIERTVQRFSMNKLVEMKLRRFATAAADSNYGGYLYCENALGFETV
jgi:hypothetical protein